MHYCVDVSTQMSAILYEMIFLCSKDGLRITILQGQSLNQTIYKLILCGGRHMRSQCAYGAKFVTPDEDSLEAVLRGSHIFLMVKEILCLFNGAI